MASDARLDLIFSAFQNLSNPFRVNEVLTSDSKTVNLSCLDFLSSCLDIHLSCAYNRLGSELLDVLNFFEVAVVRHIYRWMCPVP